MTTPQDTAVHAWTYCPECSHPYQGERCPNPGCEASGNVPPEIIARRRREEAEAAERERFARIRAACLAAEVTP